MKHVLYIVGALFEVVGILLAVAPDLVPGARRLSRWLEPRWRGAENRLRRVLRLPARVRVHNASAAGGIELAGSLTAFLSIDAAATLDAKVEFLLRRDEEQQKAIGLLHQRIADLEAEWRKQVEALRDHLEQRVSDALAASSAEYRAIRIVGAVALVLGLSLATWGNFVS